MSISPDNSCNLYHLYGFTLVFHCFPLSGKLRALELKRRGTGELSKDLSQYAILKKLRRNSSLTLRRNYCVTQKAILSQGYGVTLPKGYDVTTLGQMRFHAADNYAVTISSTTA